MTRQDTFVIQAINFNFENNTNNEQGKKRDH